MTSTNLDEKTLAVASFDDAVLASFEELPSKVATLTDLVKWFDENPKVLVGSAADIAGSAITVGLSYQSSKIIHTAQKYGTFEFSIRARVVSPQIDNPVIRSLNPFFTPTEVTHFDQTYEFEMSFGNWPIATAMVAGNLLERRAEYEDIEVIRDLLDSIDQNLSVHFPKFNMKKLEDLHSAGLLPQKQEGGIDLRSFCVFLFQSRSAQEVPSLPVEFTP